jgi:hypothetical protein
MGHRNTHVACRAQSACDEGQGRENGKHHAKGELGVMQRKVAVSSSVHHLGRIKAHEEEDLPLLCDSRHTVDGGLR